VAAALLKEGGRYDLIGVFIVGWQGTKDFPCQWQADEADARMVAEKLGIPFFSVNLSQQYYRKVITEFVAGYSRGLTPNPDILCNREIKFKALWRQLSQFEIDFIATGHYARLRRQGAGADDYGIYKPMDSAKDQTYFLWAIDGEILPRLIFPLSELIKPEVRLLAKKFDLPTFNKRDSQGVCFTGGLPVKRFLANFLKWEEGTVLTLDGRQIAKHRGVNFYTIGERLGADTVLWQGDVPPLYVVAKDTRENLLVVGNDNQTYADKFTSEPIRWLGSPRRSKFVAMVKIRYRQEDVPAKIYPSNKGAVVELGQPVRAITPGQSMVLYDSDGRLLGGATIKDVPAQRAILRKAKRHRQPAAAKITT